jgi:putative tryptophan/tyrosine transport system substrate-binding protein
MKRREFMLVLGGAAAWPIVARAALASEASGQRGDSNVRAHSASEDARERADGTRPEPGSSARAQRAAGMPTIGVLMAGIEASAENRPRIAAFLQGLRDRGWNPGQNVRIETRWSAGRSELVARYVEELAALAPDVILANSATVVDAFKRATDSVPIVFALDMDPVGLGHVKSLSHPGGNFTGFTFIDPELIGKWTELLKDLSPRLTRAAVLYNPKTLPMYENFVRELTASGQPGAAEVALLPVQSDGEMEAAIRSLGERPGSGLIIGPDPFNQVRIKQIAELAAQHRLPTVSVYRTFAVEGGLMAYGPDTADIFLRSADYVDRILKGAKPAELPVQQPNKFELVVNLKTAKVLGLEVPPMLLARADEVIE